MMPAEIPPEGMPPLPPVATGPIEPPSPPAPRYRWYDKVTAVLFITLCLDIGLFLVIFPWTSWWDNFAAFVHTWRPYLDNMYVRGGISGLGLVNLYISLGEVFRLRRFSSTS
jgi:hypothetical protein